jgi:hypothetical protein
MAAVMSRRPERRSDGLESLWQVCARSSCRVDLYVTGSIAHSTTIILTTGTACAAASTKGEHDASRPLLKHSPAPETVLLEQEDLLVERAPDVQALLHPLLQKHPCGEVSQCRC